MKFRHFVLACCLAMAWPPAVVAEQAGRTARIGVLIPGSREAYSEYLSQFVQGLRDLGHVENKTFVLNLRWADGRLDRLSAFATELVDAKFDVLVLS